MQQLQNSHIDRVSQWGMRRYARYGENNKFLVEIEKLVALNAAKSLGTCQKRSLFALECSKMRFRLGLRPRPRWGSLQRSPEPLAVEWEGNEERRKEGEEGREM